MAASENTKNDTIPPKSSSTSYDGRYDNLEWIKVNDLLGDMKGEGLREKIIRKTKQNPFVPIGVLATVVALSLGLWSMKTGNSRRSQIMMRARILAQGFTIGSILVGMAIAGYAKPDLKSDAGNS